MIQSQQGKRIVISTFGSFGDVHPYIAVALELKRRGHRPVIATAEVYREKTDAAGLELHPIRPEMPGWDQPDEVARMISDFMDSRKGTERILRWLTESARESYEDLLPAARAADLFFTHPLPFVNPSVALKAGVPWVSSVLAPISFFSVYDPSVPPQMPALHKLLKLSPAVGRAVVRLADFRLRRVVEPIKRLRAEEGLPPGKNPILGGQHSPRMVLALFSPVIAKPQADWPPNTRVTGFAFYDRRDRAASYTRAASARPRRGFAPGFHRSSSPSATTSSTTPRALRARARAARSRARATTPGRRRENSARS